MIREACFKAIKSVIKANPANFHAVSADVYKSIQKYLSSSEKTSEAGVKSLILACLRAFVSSTLNYSSLHAYFEQILAQTIKGLEDTNTDVTEENIRIC